MQGSSQGTRGSKQPDTGRRNFKKAAAEHRQPVTPACCNMRLQPFCIDIPRAFTTTAAWGTACLPKRETGISNNETVHIPVGPPP
jgi:hypothetical protein